MVGQSLELTTMVHSASARAGRGTLITVAVAVGLAVVAAGLSIALPNDITLADAPSTLVSAPTLVLAFAFGDWLLLNIEFRRQAHSLTLAGIPLVLGALLAPIQVVVLARVLGAGSTLAVQRVRPDKFVYNLAAYAFEAAADTALVHVVLGDKARLDLTAALLVLMIVACVDQLMSVLILAMIRLHDGPCPQARATHVLLPALVVTCVSTIIAIGVVLLTRAGPLGACGRGRRVHGGLVLYRGYLGTDLASACRTRAGARLRHRLRRRRIIRGRGARTAAARRDAAARGIGRDARRLD